jgi:hypothetical protein
MDDLFQFEDFLIDWRGYLYFQQLPSDLLDKNLNNLIREYLNPNPYIKTNKVIYFLVNKYNSEIFDDLAHHFDRDALENTDDQENIKLLKFMDKYDVNVVHKVEI